MKTNYSLTKKFTGVLALFVSITAIVLYLLVSAKNEPINFAELEVQGNKYQLPVEKALEKMAKLRVLNYRSRNEGPTRAQLISSAINEVNEALTSLTSVNSTLGEELQFTEQGLKDRKREHLAMKTIATEWEEAAAKAGKIDFADTDRQLTHLIADLRGVIGHLGDTSGLILDPDLDSYYLMDVTLLAVPQAQDRIQATGTDVENYLQNHHDDVAAKIKVSVQAAMMNESDLGRITGDFSTVLNEDAKFYGKLESLTSVLKPIHETFVAKYTEFAKAVEASTSASTTNVKEIQSLTDAALAASFDYEYAAIAELNKLLQARIDYHYRSKIMSAVFSSVGLALALLIASLFIRRLKAQIQKILSVLRSSTANLETASLASASSSTELSESAAGQASGLQETMASAEEISAMVNQNADSAAKVRSAVEANQLVSEEGSRSVAAMMVAIDEIKSTNDQVLSQMEDSNKEFAQIVKIISEIGEKTKVINDIVFQTKLLSFNASVEAARAGEHGKGFAVVAEEVGNLAQMSGNAAKEITDMLSGSIKRVNEIVETTSRRVDQLVEVGKDKISMGQSTAQKCRAALETIAQNAKNVSAMVAEIAAASKEQAQGVSEINKAISQLDVVTQQNAGVADRSSLQAQDLSHEVVNLTAAVTELDTFIEGSSATTSTASASLHEEVKVPTAQRSKQKTRQAA